MYTSQELSMSIKKIAREKGVSIGEMCKSCGISQNTLSNMNHGMSIAFDSLARIADYLEVPVDELLGRSSMFIIGDNSGNQNSTINSNNAQTTVSREALEIEKMLNSLSFRDKAQLMNIIVEFVESHTL